MGAEEARFVCKGPKEGQAAGKRPHRGLGVRTVVHHCVREVNLGWPVSVHSIWMALQESQLRSTTGWQEGQRGTKVQGVCTLGELDYASKGAGAVEHFGWKGQS